MSDDVFTKRSVSDDVLVIETGKILDNNNAHEMVSEISAALANNYKYILLDMTQLEFLSSAGVGSILGTVETTREAGGDIILCHASPTIIHVLTVLDLAEYLTIRESEQQAVAICTENN